LIASSIDPSPAGAETLPFAFPIAAYRSSGEAEKREMNMPDNSLSNFLRETEESWRRVVAAYQRYQIATARYRGLLEKAPECQLCGKDDSFAIARHAESETLAEYTRLLKSLNDLTAHGGKQETHSRTRTPGESAAETLISFVDDDESARDSTKTLLRSAGYWLTVKQAQTLLNTPDASTTKGLGVPDAPRPSIRVRTESAAASPASPTRAGGTRRPYRNTRHRKLHSGLPGRVEIVARTRQGFANRNALHLPGGVGAGIVSFDPCAAVGVAVLHHLRGLAYMRAIEKGLSGLGPSRHRLIEGSGMAP
jgi:hypothetical protein